MGTAKAAAKNRAKVKNPGRKKGSKNKFTTLKQAFLEAFEGLGGAEELQKWSKKPVNRKDFYQMVTKLLPKEIDATVGLDEKTLAVIINALPSDIAENVKQAMIALKG